MKTERNWLVDSQHNVKMTEQEIRDHQDEVSWYYISKYQKLSEPFIREFHERVNWEMISRNQDLSEPLIEEFEDLIHWREISWRQVLSEKFIEKHRDRLRPEYICEFQYMSLGFILRNYYWKGVLYNFILKNNKIPRETKEYLEHIKYIWWRLENEGD